MHPVSAHCSDLQGFLGAKSTGGETNQAVKQFVKVLVRGHVWVSLDACPWGYISPAGVCTRLVWGGRSLTGPGGLSRPVWRSFWDLGGCLSLPLPGGGVVCGGG